MATPAYVTLTDVAQMTHNGNIIEMAHEFEKHTSLFNSLPWKQSSDALHDVTGVVEEIPGGTWVGLDKGVKANKGRWGQREENIALLESWSVTNEKTYKIAPNGDAARWENDRLHIQGMALEAEEKLLYGNPQANINQPLGFMPRMNAVTDMYGMKSGAKMPHICLTAGGSTANKESSILLIAKGPMSPHLLYPRYKANNGIEFNAFPFENSLDSEGGNIRVAKSQFIISFGLSIAHRQTVVRIANVDTSSSTSIGNISDAIYEAFAAIPREYRASVDIWTSPKVILEMRKAYANRVNAIPSYDNAIYKNAIGDVMFDNFVIKSCDSMVDTEAVVS
jgi:hypothetical protein